MELGRVGFGGVFENNLPNNAGGGEGGYGTMKKMGQKGKPRLLFSLPWDPFFRQRKKGVREGDCRHLAPLFQLAIVPLKCGGGHFTPFDQKKVKKS